MNPTRREWITHTGLFVLVFAAYMMIDRVVTAPIPVVMPRWVPFLPWLAVPYLLQVVVSYFLVLAVSDRALRCSGLAVGVRWPCGERRSNVPCADPHSHRPASFGLASPAFFGAARYFAYQSSTR